MQKFSVWNLWKWCY